MPALCGQGKRAVGGHRPLQHRAEHHQRREEHRTDHDHGTEHGQELSGDREDLRAGQEILRRPQISEQPYQGRPEGAQDHSHGGRDYRCLREQLPPDAARQQFFTRRTQCHRLRLHQAPRREQRRAQGTQAGGEHHHALDDRQGQNGRGRPLLHADEELPQPRELLHQ